MRVLYTNAPLGLAKVSDTGGEKMGNHEEEEKDMTTIKEIKPIEVEFESESEREQFINWARSTDSIKANSASFDEMRAEIEKIRKLRFRGK